MEGDRARHRRARGRWFGAAAFVGLLALGGCAAPEAPGCAAGLRPVTTAALYFGRNAGAAEVVADADWQDFVTQEIVPRFPDGFTVSDAAGAWRGPDGRTRGERAKRLFIVLPGGADDDARLATIRSAYKTRFHQQSVLLVENRACAAF